MAAGWPRVVDGGARRGLEATLPDPVSTPQNDQCTALSIARVVWRGQPAFSSAFLRMYVRRYEG